ncbi:hypothetical protein LOAG_07679 [Loa loa]|uniref:Transposase n=1 Tax=Loa loa TaxID=7209 RepID=A0A1I7W488_LOALO|nr:hypothetical protein LOAG_07679 [Loa loa]EFO20810.1 hypothetical protein LOAG_07679 [Loa loa]
MEKQFGQNINRSRKEIRAILSARNRSSPRELREYITLLTTSMYRYCAHLLRNNQAHALREEMMQAGC